jgi:hypothetical protein
MDDVRTDVADDFRWLSYAELGQACEISTASAIRLAYRRKWRRQDGNDGTVRVAVPVDDAKPQSAAADRDKGDVRGDIGQVVDLLETAAATLRERGEAAEVMLAALDRNAEEALAQAEWATRTEREARRRAEEAMAGAEARLAQLSETLDRVRHEADALCSAERAAKEKAEAEVAQLRQIDQARRNLGLLARLRAALRRE